MKTRAERTFHQGETSAWSDVPLARTLASARNSHGTNCLGTSKRIAIYFAHKPRVSLRNGLIPNARTSQTRHVSPMRIPSREGWRKATAVAQRRGGSVLYAQPTPGPDGPCPSQEGIEPPFSFAHHSAHLSGVAAPFFVPRGKGDAAPSASEGRQTTSDPLWSPFSRGTKTPNPSATGPHKATSNIT